LLSSRHVHGRLAQARALLSKSRPVETPPPVIDADEAEDEDAVVALVRRLTGIDLRRCPRCHEMTMALCAAPLPNERAASIPDASSKPTRPQPTNTNSIAASPRVTRGRIATT
jgi:hypothetical protein